KSKKSITSSADESVIKLTCFTTGVTMSLPPEYKTVYSVAVDFLNEGIPVIYVRVIISIIINKYGMVYNPSTVTPPG
ncbi:poly-gamma-glutamate system protein, partial [Francisella tularensis subsp. holarctica]|nr:poly-gamma-glutamate system protein [Francisella tularensis subsp. holarctica]